MLLLLGGGRNLLPMGPDIDVPWEPPIHGSESEHLLGALDRLRMTFRWKAGGLDVAGLRARVGASTMTLVDCSSISHSWRVTTPRSN